MAPTVKFLWATYQGLLWAQLQCDETFCFGSLLVPSGFQPRLWWLSTGWSCQGPSRQPVCRSNWPGIVGKANLVLQVDSLLADRQQCCLVMRQADKFRTRYPCCHLPPRQPSLQHLSDFFASFSGQVLPHVLQWHWYPGHCNSWFDHFLFSEECQKYLAGPAAFQAWCMSF